MSENRALQHRAFENKIESKHNFSAELNSSYYNSF